LTEMPTEKPTKSESELEVEVRTLKRLIHAIIALTGDQLIEKAKAFVGEAPEMSKEWKVTFTRKIKRKLTAIETLEMLEAIGKERERKQRIEYQRMIAENNNNNH